MNKRDFLLQIEKGLQGLPEEDIRERLAFLSEMIDDRMEDGLTESEAVADVGPAERVIAQIIAETPLPRLVREKVRPKHKLSPIEIVLLILGSPIWLSLLIAAIAIVLSLYAVLWSLIASLWAVFGALCASGVGLLASSPVFFIQGHVATGICVIGGGILILGLSILLFFACNAATRGTALLTKKIAIGIKNLIMGKGDK